MINLRFYFDEYKRELAEIRIFIQSVELQKDVISEIEFYEKQGEKKVLFGIILVFKNLLTTK